MLKTLSTEVIVKTQSGGICNVPYLSVNSGLY
jgi:hypothetical protein